MAAMTTTDSILDTTKKTLGYDPSYTAFDPDIIMHINSVLADLVQIGIGPPEGFEIDGAEETWTQFLGPDPRYNSAKTYLYLRIRMIFDPPANSFTQTSMKEQIAQWEWRLRETKEGETWPRVI